MIGAGLSATSKRKSRPSGSERGSTLPRALRRSVSATIPRLLLQGPAALCRLTKSCLPITLHAAIVAEHKETLDMLTEGWRQ